MHLKHLSSSEKEDSWELEVDRICNNRSIRMPK